MAIKSSDMLTQDQINTVYNIAADYGTDPKLILAIGWLETQWGRIGDGLKGMFTGYGSYDSGSDYSQSGFESQVRGTAQKMTSWGIAKDDVNLLQLEMGNNGVLPTGIYATDREWAKKVYNIYTQIDTDLEPTGTSGTGTGTGTSNSSETGTVDKSKWGVRDWYLYLTGQSSASTGILQQIPGTNKTEIVKIDPVTGKYEGGGKVIRYAIIGLVGLVGIFAAFQMFKITGKEESA